MSGQPQKPRKPTCFNCGRTIGTTAPKTVIEGQWHCADCTYLHDHPDAQEPPPRARKRRSYKSGKLFD